MTEKELDRIYELLIYMDLFTEQELDLITCINGYSIETLDDCCYARYGERSAVDLLKTNYHIDAI